MCPAADLFQDLANYCRKLWQANCDECVYNKLHSIKPLLGYSNVSHLSRFDSVILQRLRIDHTNLLVQVSSQWRGFPTVHILLFIWNVVVIAM